MRRLFLLFSLIAVFSVAYQSSHAAKILYVFGNGTVPNAGDQMVINHFTAQGHTVTTILDSTVAAGGAADAAGTNDVVYISGGCASGNIRGKGYETLAKPIISGHQNATLPASNTGAGPLGFGTANNGQSNMSQVFIDPTAATSVLAADLSGTVTLFTNATLPVSRVTAGVAPNAPLFALLVPNTTNYNCMIAIDAGGKLADGSIAPAKRLLTHVYTDATRNNAAIMTAQGWRLFDAQLYWCLGLPLPTVPPTVAPAATTGLILKGQPLITTVTLNNPNSTSLSFNALKITGPAASVFSVESPKTLPLTVAGLKSSPILVKALPTTLGVSTATLQIGYNNSASTLTVALSVTAAVYEPGFITGVTATASTAESSRPATLAVNGSGITEPVGLLGSRQATHNNSNTTMWRTAGTADVTNGTNWIQFDLGQVYSLSEMWVWNYNEISGSTYYNQRGAKNCTISYSTDGTNYTTLGTFDLGRTANLAAAPASNLDGTGLPVNFGNVPVRYVKIAVNSTWEKTTGTGFIGISEVRFYQFVPPPNKVRRWSLFE